jgi:hypothetical protein
VCVYYLPSNARIQTKRNKQKRAKERKDEEAKGKKRIQGTWNKQQAGMPRKGKLPLVQYVDNSSFHP